MSTHGDIKVCGHPNFSPDVIEGEGIRFEINMPDFLWADDKKEALAFLDRIIQSAQEAKRTLLDRT
jgi:hypothetical protein